MIRTIRMMTVNDKSRVMELMRIFYASPAVLSNGSDKIFSDDIDNCLNENPYLEGYVMENETEIQGYAMVAKSYSTEFGKPCIWIEDLYIDAPYRGLGLGKSFLEFIMQKYEGCVFRLEVEAENERAVKLYEACGFEVLPYMEMKK